ncbi:hypothetical protein XPA_009933 [Xanthoria parietina]
MDPEQYYDDSPEDDEGDDKCYDEEFESPEKEMKQQDCPARAQRHNTTAFTINKEL